MQFVTGQDEDLRANMGQHVCTLGIVAFLERRGQLTFLQLQDMREGFDGLIECVVQAQEDGNGILRHSIVFVEGIMCRAESKADGAQIQVTHLYPVGVPWGKENVT